MGSLARTGRHRYRRCSSSQGRAHAVRLASAGADIIDDRKYASLSQSTITYTQATAEDLVEETVRMGEGPRAPARFCLHREGRHSREDALRELVADGNRTVGRIVLWWPNAGVRGWGRPVGASPDEKWET